MTVALGGLGRLRARRNGRIERFASSEGVGIVRDEDGSAYLFHCTAIADGSREIEEETSVSFELSLAQCGRIEATAVVSFR